MGKIKAETKKEHEENSEKSVVEKEKRKKSGLDDLKKHAILHCVVD